MKLVKSRFFDWYWVENENGERVSDRFKITSKDECGPITRCCLDKYNILTKCRKEYIIITPDRYFFVNDWNDFEYKGYNDTYYCISAFADHKRIKTVYSKDGEKTWEDTYIQFYDKESGLFHVESKGKFGFTDENLNWVIEPKFLSIKTTFLSERAVVEIEKGKCVIIDKEGNHICAPFECDEVVSILSGKPFLKIGRERKYIGFGSYVTTYKGIVDFEGNVIIPTEYNDVEKAGEYFKLTLNGKHGLADSKGNIILECIYPEIIDLKDKFVVPEFNAREIKKEVPKEA